MVCSDGAYCLSVRVCRSNVCVWRSVSRRPPSAQGVCCSSDPAKAIVTETPLWIQFALPSYGYNLYFVDCRFLRSCVI